MGLTCGAIDLAVDERGEYVFFEINPYGQFLFGEHLVPEMPLLDAFATFLVSRDPEFTYEPVAHRGTMAAFNVEVDFEVEASHDENADLGCYCSITTRERPSH